MGRRAPRRVSAAIAPLLAQAAPKTTLAAVQLAWPRAAGDAVAREAEPVAEREGIVTIACSSAAWAEQLDLLQGQLLESLGEASGAEGKLRGLRFRVGRESIAGDSG